MLLGMKRVIHRAHLEVWSRHEVKDGTGVVHRWMEDNYADSMLMGLRRVLDKSRQSFSLIKLLEDIARKHSLLTSDRYVELWRLRQEANDDSFPRMLYTRFSSDGRSLATSRIRDDIDRLRGDHDDLLKFIDSVVAHREDANRKDPSSGPSPEVTWADLDRLFEDVAALFNKYYDLVNPGVHVDFTPVLPAGFERALVRMVACDDG